MSADVCGDCDGENPLCSTRCGISLGAATAFAPGITIGGRVVVARRTRPVAFTRRAIGPYGLYALRRLFARNEWGAEPPCKSHLFFEGQP